MVVKSLYRISTGEIVGGIGPFEPSIPQVPNPTPTPERPWIADPDIGIAVYGDVKPSSINPRLHKWNGSAKVNKSQAEIDSYDAAQKDARAAKINEDALIQAVAQLDYEERQKLQVKNGQTLRDPAQCKARIKAIYRSLL